MEGVEAVIDEHVRRGAPEGLRPFVSGYSGYRQAGLRPGTHRGLPSPALTFIVTLDDPVVITAHPDRRQSPGSYDTVLGGLHTSPAMISHDGRQSGVQLALTPLGARALLGMPAAELTNWDGEATEVLGAFAAELRERVRDRQTWAGRFAVIDELLAARAARAAREHVRPEVGHVWRRLRATHGAVPVTALAQESGCSARHLSSLLRAEVGLAPKAVARLFRFDHARRRIARAGAVPLADLAAECGYYDQAHLAREFNEMAGCPPTQWLAEEFRFVQATPEGAGRLSGT